MHSLLQNKRKSLKDANKQTLEIGDEFYEKWNAFKKKARPLQEE